MTFLKNLHVKEVSLVDKAANQRRFLLFKSEDGVAEDIDKKNMDPNVGGGVDRDKIPAEDFVDPKLRRFPIVTASDVKDAVSSYGRAKPPIPFEQFKSRLTAIARRKGFESQLPENWKETQKGDDKDMDKKTKADMSPECMAACKECLTACKECLTSLNKFAGENEEVQECCDDLQECCDSLNEAMGGMTKADLSKADLPEAVKAQLNAILEKAAYVEEQLKAAQAEKAVEVEKAKAAQDALVTKEYIEKADPISAGLATSKEELGPVLKWAYETDKGKAEYLEGLLKAASTAIAKGDLFKEVGKAGGTNEGGDQLEMLIKAEIAADPNLVTLEKSANPVDRNSARAQAIEKVMSKNPGLYASTQKAVSKPVTDSELVA